MKTRDRRSLAVLGACPLFAGLQAGDLAAVARAVDWVTLPAGATLMSEGDSADAVYVLAWGRLAASQVGPDGGEVPLGEIGRGDFVGELALVSGTRRSATLRALRDSALVRLSRASLDRLVTSSPNAPLALTRAIAARYAAPSRKGSDGAAATLALLPATEGFPVGGFAAEVLAALRKLGSTSLLRPDRVDAQLGAGVADAPQDDARHARLSEWLDEQEQAYRYLLYVAPSADGAWTQRCLRQADRILVAGQAELSPTPRWSRLVETARARRVELALVHRGSPLDWTPSAEWLDTLPLHAHHHVRKGVAGDLGRLARRLTDRAVGVALGGGGTRSTAYVGVLRALAEAGVSVDLIASISGGSVVGSMAALGYDDQQMREGLKGLLRGNSLLDLGPPFVSLLNGRRWTRLFRRMLGESDLECLSTEFLGVASDLTTNRKTIPRRGPLWRAALASATLPGLTPPVEVEGHLLVDGGLTTLLPTEELRGPCARGAVIALHAGAPPLQPTRAGYGTILSGWRLLWERLSPFVKRSDVPPLREILLSAACLHAADSFTSAAADADLYIDLPMPDLTLFGVDSEKMIDAVAERGYEHAKAPIERWLQAQEAGHDHG